MLDLNFVGTLIPTQDLSEADDWQGGRSRHQYFVDERAVADDEGSGLQRSESRHRQFHAVARCPFSGSWHSRKRDCAGLLPDGAEPNGCC